MALTAAFTMGKYKIHSGLSVAFCEATMRRQG